MKIGAGDKKGGTVESLPESCCGQLIMDAFLVRETGFFPLTNVR
jgi:hypothetical protein